ncbi:glycosyltransferase 87 family protein [Actinosynnema sp. NPDC059797]
MLKRIPEPALHALCAAFAAVVTVIGLPNHRVWAWWALCAYSAAALLTLLRPGARPAVVRLVTLGALVGPLAHLAATGRAQNEVTAVFEAARRLLDGRPLYPTGADLADAVARSGVDAYFPYLPAMALLGVPAVLAARAGLGPVLSDPRLTFLLVHGVAVLFVARRTGAGRSGLWLVLVTSPPAALLLATGGHDLAVVGALLVAVVLSRDGRPVAAGLVAGLACAAKLTAWPLVVALAAVDRRRFAVAGSAAAVVAVFLLPASAAGLLVHDVRFPAGLEAVPSPAAAPFPGRLVAEHVPGGRVLAVVLLVAAAVVLLVRLARRPPRGAAGAAFHCAAGLAAATLLAPATRPGYLVYPLALLVVGLLVRDDDQRSSGGRSRTDVATPAG